MKKELNKYKDIFLSEAKEHVASMNASLLKFEKSPAKVELVNDIFRHAHTLKSMAATMDYTKTTALCHTMEDVLDAIKKRKIKPVKCIDTLFECFDALEATLKSLKDGNDEFDTASLIERLQPLATSVKSAVAASANSAVATSADLAVEKIQSIEIKVERLDLLMNLTEELLINKMRLDRIKEDLQDPDLTSVVDTLGKLIADVQYNVMQSRMVPIGFVFNRFPRMIRDLAKQQKKEIALLMNGSDIELDRSMIDEIGESLVHLLRNAVDHGIEVAQERVKAGKPSSGTIKLTAERTKNYVVIEVADDGGGLDIEDIKNTAIKRGLLSSQTTKEEIMDSIFSGVSTTKEVTAVSGRGFGLNIVKSKIESLGGTIKAESEPQKGTTFLIELPLTLAIIKALFVEVGDRIYAIPLASVERLVTVKQKDIKGMVDYEAIVLNEEDILITRLDILFDVPTLALKKQPIVIISRGEEQLGLAVNEFLNTQEIVVKPLNRLVRENKYFAGSTIIGSGAAVLILDIANLILSKRLQPQRTQISVKSTE